MHKPTPTDRPLDLRGEVVKLGERSVQTRGVILADGKTTATCEATFVVVKPDHPAYHRWESSDRER
jgi:acyl-coenzyme A thioesterase PaaI-like protein